MPRTRVLLIFILLATALVYIQSLSFQFTYDDEPQIVTNPRVHSFQYLPSYFTQNVWSHEGERGNYFRPVFLIALLLQYKLFGVNVIGWHLVSITFHLLATWLVFLFARRMLAVEDTALIAALLFGLAPVHVEVVVWASAISDSMIAVFLTASFLLYLRWREEQRWMQLAASLGLFILALLTKEPAITFVGVIAAYEFLYGGLLRVRVPHTSSACVGTDTQVPERMNASSAVLARKQIWSALFLFFITSVIYLGWRTHVLHALGYRTLGVTTLVIIMTLPWLAWFCASKLLFAWQLSTFYDAPYVNSLSSPDALHDLWLPLLAIIIVAIAIYAFWRATRDRFVPFALIWIVLPLLPLLNFGIFNEHDYAHDRYLYLPSVAGCTLIAFALSRLRPSRLGRQLQYATVAVLAISYAAVVISQSVYWGSSLLLYARGAQVSPRFGALPRTNLAGKLLDRGQYDAALEQYMFVLRLKPNNWLTNMNVGDALFRMDRFQEAEKYHLRAAELRPDPDVLLRLGLTRMRLHDYAGAEIAMRQALDADHRSANKLYALALCLKEEGKYEEARNLLREAAQKSPNDPVIKQRLEELEKQVNGSARSAKAPGSR